MGLRKMDLKTGQSREALSPYPTQALDSNSRPQALALNQAGHCSWLHCSLGWHPEWPGTARQGGPAASGGERAGLARCDVSLVGSEVFCPPVLHVFLNVDLKPFRLKAHPLIKIKWKSLESASCSFHSFLSRGQIWCKELRKPTASWPFRHAEFPFEILGLSCESYVCVHTPNRADTAQCP